MILKLFLLTKAPKLIPEDHCFIIHFRISNYPLLFKPFANPTDHLWYKHPDSQLKCLVCDILLDTASSDKAQQNPCKPSFVDDPESSPDDFILKHFFVPTDQTSAVCFACHKVNVFYFKNVFCNFINYAQSNIQSSSSSTDLLMEKSNSSTYLSSQISLKSIGQLFSKCNSCFNAGTT